MSYLLDTNIVSYILRKNDKINKKLRITTSPHKFGKMHVISFRILREYGENHADCQEALSNWYKVATKAQWTSLVEVQQVFPKAEAVGNFTVFNLKGNKYRLIVSIDYEGQLIYIKYILTHAEYDKDGWKNDSYF